MGTVKNVCTVIYSPRLHSQKLRFISLDHFYQVESQLPLLLPHHSNLWELVLSINIISCFVL